MFKQCPVLLSIIAVVIITRWLSELSHRSRRCSGLGASWASRAGWAPPRCSCWARQTSSGGSPSSSLSGHPSNGPSSSPSSLRVSSWLWRNTFLMATRQSSPLSCRPRRPTSSSYSVLKCALRLLHWDLFYTRDHIWETFGTLWILWSFSLGRLKILNQV